MFHKHILIYPKEGPVNFSARLADPLEDTFIHSYLRALLRARLDQLYRSERVCKYGIKNEHEADMYMYQDLVHPEGRKLE